MLILQVSSMSYFRSVDMICRRYSYWRTVWKDSLPNLKPLVVAYSLHITLKLFGLIFKPSDTLSEHNEHSLRLKSSATIIEQENCRLQALSGSDIPYDT